MRSTLWPQSYRQLATKRDVHSRSDPGMDSSWPSYRIVVCDRGVAGHSPPVSDDWKDRLHYWGMDSEVINFLHTVPQTNRWVGSFHKWTGQVRRESGVPCLHWCSCTARLGSPWRSSWMGRRRWCAFRSLSGSCWSSFVVYFVWVQVSIYFVYYYTFLLNAHE